MVDKRKAQKAVGGTPQNSHPHPPGSASTAYTDHAGHPALSAYLGNRSSQAGPVLPPLWSYQLYVILADASAATYRDLPVHILEAVRNDMAEPYPLRFDVNFLPGATMEDCMAHYRAEKTSRVEKNAPLAFPETYGHYEPARGFLVVVDNPDWETQGVTTASFDYVSREDIPDDNDDDELPPAMSVRKGVKISRKPGNNGIFGSFGPGPDGAGCLADVLDDKAGSEAFDECREKYDEAVEAGRGTWA